MIAQAIASKFDEPIFCDSFAMSLHQQDRLRIRDIKSHHAVGPARHMQKGDCGQAGLYRAANRTGGAVLWIVTRGRQVIGDWYL
jgi:hypothetical protein